MNRWLFWEAGLKNPVPSILENRGDKLSPLLTERERIYALGKPVLLKKGQDRLVDLVKLYPCRVVE